MLEIIGLVLPGITKLLNKLIPDSDARNAAQEEITKLLIAQQGAVNLAIAEAAKAQAAINLAEASSPSIFVSGWRPAAAWICIAGMLYSFCVQPTATWIALQFHLTPLPTLDTATMMSLLFGLLGLGGLRSFDKMQGTSFDNVTSPRLPPGKR